MIINHIRRYHLATVVLLLVSLSLVAACGILPSSTATSSSVFAIQPGTRISLSHSPTGTAALAWSESNHMLMVFLSATGLAPNSTHLVHIHAGSCTAMGQIVYSLHPLVADSTGNGSSSTDISSVMSGMPRNGWAINIHNGPSLATPLPARSIACGNIGSVRVAHGTQSAQVQLSSTISPDEAVHGIAQMRMMMDHTLVVSLSLSGLAPNTTHVAHIHTGSCQEQGPVVYTLQPIVADASGNATTITTLTINKPLPTHMYINVHEAATMAAMGTSLGFDPIACGNIG